MHTREKTYKLVLSALFLALCLVLPMITGGIPTIGNMLLPMHISVLLCGLLCGWQYGLVIGFVAPLLRSVLFGMPPMYPVAIAMAFELAAYGLIIGLVYRLLPKHGVAALYISLLTAMVAAKLCGSNREARQLVQQGGVLVDGEKVTDPKTMLSEEALRAGVVIKKGKKVYHKVTL